MKTVKLLLSLLILATIQTNASRTKKNLLKNQEQEIISLLEKKEKVLDTLIKEAQIYSQETDPLIKKDFYGADSGFFTTSLDSSIFIETNMHNPKTVKPKEKSKKLPTSNKMGVPMQTFVSKANKRDILGIAMQMVAQSTTTFRSHRNFLNLIDMQAKQSMKELNSKTQKKELSNEVDTIYETKFKTVSESVKAKYSQLITLLSSNSESEKFNPLLSNEHKSEWIISSKIVLFAFDLQKDDFYQKKLYNLSMSLDGTFESLQAKKSIKSTDRPYYYNRKIHKKKCLESSAEIKYKGRICINYIDVGNNNFFKKGTFETRENNFLQRNAKYFKSLVDLDRRIKNASKEYLKFEIIKISTASLTKEIDLENGL